MKSIIHGIIAYLQFYLILKFAPLLDPYLERSGDWFNSLQPSLEVQLFIFVPVVIISIVVIFCICIGCVLLPHWVIEKKLDKDIK